MIDAILSGLPSGGAYAIVGIAVVLMYRLAGVTNIAVSVFGAFGAFIMVSSHDHGLGLTAAVVVGLVSGAVLSTAAGIVMAWGFAESDAITRMVVTIGMAISSMAVAFRVFGDTARSFPALFGGSSLEVGDQSVKTTSIVAVALAVLIAVGLSLLLRRTRLGVRMEATSERPVSAELLGLPRRRYTVLVWAVGGVVATIAPILVAPTRQADFTSLSLLVVPGLAAALLAAFRSLMLTLVAGLGIGVVESVAVRWESISTYRAAVPFVLIIAGLLWSQRKEVWDEAR